MPDIYLCGNGSDTGTDITLRGAAPCTSASTGGLAPRLRVLHRYGRFQLTLTLQGRGAAKAHSSSTVAIQATSAPSVSAGGRTVVDLHAKGAGSPEATGHIHTVAASGRGTTSKTSSTHLTVALAGRGRASDDDLVLALL